jgi:hypothetical protein
MDARCAFATLSFFKARRAVLRGQKTASTMTFVSKTTVMPGV